MKKTGTVVKKAVILNLIQDLQRTLLRKYKGNDKRGRWQIKSAMTSYLKGFTLIELLVVVLIIGILAAVAVPQYQKAVEKSRWTEWITVMNALEKDAQLAFLENAFADGEADEGVCENFSIAHLFDNPTKNFRYSIGECSPSEIYIDTYRLSSPEINMEARFYPDGTKEFDAYTNDHPLADMICQMLTNYYGSSFKREY